MSVMVQVLGIVVLAAGSLMLLVYLLRSESKHPETARLRELSAQGKPVLRRPPTARGHWSALPKIGNLLLPATEEEQTWLKARLVHAGMYRPYALQLYLGVKIILILFPVLVGWGISWFKVVTQQNGLIGGLVGSAVGLVAPGIWLDRRKIARQNNLRRALPDALDILVICVEGGLSLQGALQRVANELRTAHPKLALEMNIIQNEVQMGLSTGEAIRHFAERCDLDEVRSLAAVVIQSERYGASLVKSLRVHAENLRVKRLQRAEELAQKAIVKILFPTVLLIFPAIFVVIIGPAGIQIWRMFAKMKAEEMRQ